MLRKQIIFSLIVLLIFISVNPDIAGAQTTGNTDTFFLAKKKGFWGKLGKSISVSGITPPSVEEGVKKNEESYSKFKGKVIHSIRIQKFDFSGSVNDTGRINKNFFTDIGNRLHPNTSDKIIKRNLFFAENDTLYPALVADNERYLRDISYLQDARIIVSDNKFIPNEVDVTVLCKDVFPVGGSADLGSEKLVNFELNDDNLGGTGDRVAFKNMIDLDRVPKFGLGGQFLKRNVLGTFVSINFGFSNIEPAFNSGRREETAWYFKADLPLVSPYSILTGGYEASVHFTKNNYLSDSLYNSDFKYSYRLFDSWIGYNIGAKKQLSLQIKNRLKHVLGVRGIYRQFFDIPNIYQTKYNSAYSNLTTILTSVSVFEQDYYHTNFIYGFGRNEDVPEGFSMSLIGGWTNRNDISRPYLGFDYQRNYFTRKKSYVNYQFKMGGYFANGGMEDISLLTGVEYFTRLRKLGNSKWLLRHFFNGSITQQIKTKLNDPLHISSIYGLPELNITSINASSRITGNWESVFYNTWKFFGFSFAPFAFTNITFLKEQSLDFVKGDVYSSIGAGVRTRNENLVFGTMELRAYYYPRTISSMNVWNVVFNTALQFKYNSQLVKRPDFVAVN